VTALTLEKIRPVGIGIGLWSVSGAAAPTLVVTSNRRLADPLPVLETAVATLGRPVVKVALAHPADDLDVAAEYVFAQVVERGDQQILDLTPECGHSMLATATHLAAHSHIAAGQSWLRLLTCRSGKRRIVTCEVRPHPDSGAVAGGDGYYAEYEAGLSFPLDDPATVFPLGTGWFPLSVAGREVSVTVIDSGNPYAFVDARSVGITDGAALLSAGPESAALLAEVRRQVAPRIGLAASVVLPKPALLLRPTADVAYVRALSAEDWHPALALTGQIAVATLLAASAAGGIDLTINHPGGVAKVGLRTEPDGGRTLVVAHRRVVRLTPISEAR
jgi:2-methylaconitate cis-trans-isomerase PrpF